MQVYCLIFRTTRSYPREALRKRESARLRLPDPGKARDEAPAVGIGPHRPIAHPAAGRFTFYDTPSTHELLTGLSRAADPLATAGG